MSKIVIWKCDECGREYKYNMASGDRDREPLQYIHTTKKEYCRECLKFLLNK